MKEIMSSTVLTSEILVNCQWLCDALNMLGYSMDYLNYTDHDDKEFREIASNICGGIECLKSYQNQITDDIEMLLDKLQEEHEREEREREKRLDEELEEELTEQPKRRNKR